MIRTLALLAAVLASNVFAQPVLRKNHISGSPASLSSITLAAEYERVVSEHVTVFGGIEGAPLLKGFGGALGVRFYPSESLKGFFVDAHMTASRAVLLDEAYRTIGGGALLGTAWQLDHGFELTVGGGLDVVDVRSDSGRASSPTSFALPWVLAAAVDGLWDSPLRLTDGVRVAPTMKFTLGYAF